jgi:DNA polymerase-4
VIQEHQVEGFLKDLPVGKLPGVGQKALKTLHDLGIIRTGQLRKLPESILVRKFGRFGHALAELSRGIDASEVVPQRKPKSISSETTLEEDTEDIAILRDHIIAQAEDVGRRLRAGELKCRTVTLKLKSSDFRLITRSQTIDRSTDSSKVVADTALELLENEKPLSKVRLVGVGASNFDSTAQQLGLFERFAQGDEKQARVDRAMDAVSERFGEDLLKRGT